MTAETTLRQRLEDRVRRALEPARFPERRDVELAFSIQDRAQDVVFLDHFWLCVSDLWVVAAQADRGGLDGVLAATGLRQLLRALAAEFNDPEAVLAALGTEWGADVAALAIMRLDVSTGRVSQAARGAGRCDEAADPGSGKVRWLAIGEPGLPGDRDVPVEGLQALVDRHAQASRPVLAAVQFKARSKRMKSIMLAVRNDRAGVPDALSAARSFLEGHAVAEDDVSALELALDEILTNQINYGYRDGAAHEILIEARIEGDRLCVEIRDDGVPFDPLSVAPPDLDAGIEERQIGGLGMHFVRSLVDEASYRRNGGWNVLVLGKKMGPRQGKEVPA